MNFMYCWSCCLFVGTNKNFVCIDLFLFSISTHKNNIHCQSYYLFLLVRVRIIWIHVCPSWLHFIIACKRTSYMDDPTTFVLAQLMRTFCASILCWQRRTTSYFDGHAHKKCMWLLDSTNAASIATYRNFIIHVNPACLSGVRACWKGGGLLSWVLALLVLSSSVAVLLVAFCWRA